MLFRTGKLVMTRGFISLFGEGEDARFQANEKFEEFFARHQSGDWGQLSRHDKKHNEQAVREGWLILSVYDVNGANVYVITEADRSITTALLPEEY